MVLIILFLLFEHHLEQTNQFVLGLKGLRVVEPLDIFLLQNFSFEESNKVIDMHNFGFSFQVTGVIFLVSCINDQMISTHIRCSIIFRRKQMLLKSFGAMILIPFQSPLATSLSCI